MEISEGISDARVAHHSGNGGSRVFAGAPLGAIVVWGNLF